MRLTIIANFRIGTRVNVLLRVHNANGSTVCGPFFPFIIIIIIFDREE